MHTSKVDPAGDRADGRFMLCCTSLFTIEGLSVDFAHTRQENDEVLLNRLDEIRRGEALDVLEPFAKAYLGLFYDIDSQLAPAERLDLLASGDLASAIKQGFISLLSSSDLPGPKEITRANLQQENLTIGYVVLAGVSLQSEMEPAALVNLPDATLQSAICFHHYISTFHEDSWYKPLLLEKPELSSQTLLQMWRILIDAKNDFLPGLRSLLQEEEMIPLFKRVVVPLLRIWRNCRHRDLVKLLSLAIIHVERDVLLETAREMLVKGELLNLRNQVYWQATAFLLAPEEQGQHMLNFMGQEKIKLLPFLDFVMPLLDHETAPFQLSAQGYAFLIRCLAQKFTPQLDMYDNLGEITVKVVWLFYRLACFTQAEGATALQGLRRVRVLKLYSDIFDAIADQQSRPDKQDFQTFVQRLRDEGRLRTKKNWHDAR